MDHLTPDELAAWMEGTLSLAERSAAEAHASDCAHCQAMLAAMARTAPEVARRPSWIGSVKWLVPIAAAAIAIAVWVGVTRESAPAQVARTEAPVTLPSKPETKPPAVELSGEGRAQLAQVPPRREAKEELSKQTAQTRNKDLDHAAQAFGAVAGGKVTDRADALAPSVASPPAAPSSVPPPPPPAPSPASAAGQAAATPAPAAPPAAPAEPQPAKPQALNETVSVAAEAPAGAGRAALQAPPRMPPVEVMSPERSYRWRALTPGSIQYSVDGGLSWRSSNTGTAVALHAGSAPSRKVCWLVGQAGLVLLTTDGQSWQVRPFPERLDLTSVSATDARNATVTAADRRRFATADGGATWAPLQEN